MIRCYISCNIQRSKLKDDSRNWKFKSCGSKTRISPVSPPMSWTTGNATVAYGIFHVNQMFTGLFWCLAFSEGEETTPGRLKPVDSPAHAQLSALSWCGRPLKSVAEIMHYNVYGLLDTAWVENGNGNSVCYASVEILQAYNKVIITLVQTFVILCGVYSTEYLLGSLRAKL